MPPPNPFKNEVKTVIIVTNVYENRKWSSCLGSFRAGRSKLTINGNERRALYAIAFISPTRYITYTQKILPTPYPT